jgi:hypothetical protein
METEMIEKASTCASLLYEASRGIGCGYLTAQPAAPKSSAELLVGPHTC